jgi:mono/diheme cytochrome c family protein
MVIRTLAAAMVLALALPGTSNGAQAPFVLKSETVTLPASTRSFPGGAAADPVNANCVTCHSPGMVLNQPPLPRATWEAEVRKMINVYKAPIQDAAIAPIVAYLAQIRGAN